jgi:hypothetical protein
MGFFMVKMKLVAFCVAICLIFSASQPASGKNTDDTLMAGQPFQTELWGMDIRIPSRDRRPVTAVNAGGQWIPAGRSLCLA